MYRTTFSEIPLQVLLIQLQDLTFPVSQLIEDMGGDGGTKAVNRAYLRGAGSATTTGDIHKAKNKDGDKQIDDEEATRAMQYCYITDQPLHFSLEENFSQSSSTGSIVTCRYGRLYNKEAAIEALLQRKRMSKAATGESDKHGAADQTQSRLGLHVRGLKDLYDIRFQINHNGNKSSNNKVTVLPVPICPITGRELNGRIVAYALIPGLENTVNVVSEYALKQLSESDILTEYGATKKIRLLLPSSLYNVVDSEHLNEINQNSTKKKSKHEKRQHQTNNSDNNGTNKKSKVDGDDKE